MIELIEQHRAELNELCRKYRVKTLEVFGSATDGTWDAAQRSGFSRRVSPRSYRAVLRGLLRFPRRAAAVIRARSIWSCLVQSAIPTFAKLSISSGRCSMPHNAPTLLEDIRHSAALVLTFAAGRSLPDYSGDDMLRSAIERQFIFIGEALSRLEKLDSSSRKSTCWPFTPN